MGNNEKIKTILFVTNNYTPYTGGVVSSIKAFKEGLEKQGNKVFVVTLDFPGKPTTDDESVIRLFCPIKFWHKTNPMAIPLNCDNQIEHIIQKLKPTIIHSHHPFLLGHSALINAQKFQIPIVFTYHTQYLKYLHYIPLPSYITKSVVQNMVNNYCNNVDMIIAPSQSIKDQLSFQTIKPINVIPSCISNHFFQPVELSKKIRQRFQLITVSRFTKEKNIPFLLDVYAQLPHSKFTFKLVGFGSEYQKLKHYAYQILKLSPQHIQFIEKPSKDYLLQLYRQSDIFIFASTTETQGIVLAEAMACKLPAIAIKAAGTQDIVDHGNNGFLISTQKEMIDYIFQLTNNKELYKRLSDKAFQTSLKFTSDSLSSQLIQAYNQLL